MRTRTPRLLLGNGGELGRERWNLRLSVVHGPFVSYYTSIGHKEFIALLSLCATVYGIYKDFTELAAFLMSLCTVWLT
jgi:hypothetical protein